MCLDVDNSDQPTAQTICGTNGRAAGLPHRGDEPVQGLPPLRVLDRDGAEVVSEPDGRDDPARVAVGDVLLHREGKKKRVRELVVLLDRPRIAAVTTDPAMFRKKENNPLGPFVISFFFLSLAVALMSQSDIVYR